MLNLILTPKAWRAFRTTSPTLVNISSLNLMSSVLMASENKVKTSSACTASGSDLYCSNLLAKLLSFTLLASILFIYSFKVFHKDNCETLHPESIMSRLDSFIQKCKVF